MKELIEKYVDKKATINTVGLTVEVVIKDVKMSYGKARFLVAPVAGEGSIWVETVTLLEE